EILQAGVSLSLCKLPKLSQQQFIFLGGLRTDHSTVLRITEEVRDRLLNGYSQRGHFAGWLKLFPGTASFDLRNASLGGFPVRRTQGLANEIVAKLTFNM